MSSLRRISGAGGPRRSTATAPSRAGCAGRRPPTRRRPRTHRSPLRSRPLAATPSAPATARSCRSPPAPSGGPGRAWPPAETAAETGGSAADTSLPRWDWAGAAARPRSPAPRGESPPRVRVVDRLLHRQVVGDQVAPGEAAAGQEGVGPRRARPAGGTGSRAALCAWTSVTPDCRRRSRPLRVG